MLRTAAAGVRRGGCRAGSKCSASTPTTRAGARSCAPCRADSPSSPAPRADGVDPRRRRLARRRARPAAGGRAGPRTAAGGITSRSRSRRLARNFPGAPARRRHRVRERSAARLRHEQLERARHRVAVALGRVGVAARHSPRGKRNIRSGLDAAAYYACIENGPPVRGAGRRRRRRDPRRQRGPRGDRRGTRRLRQRVRVRAAARHRRVRRAGRRGASSSRRPASRPARPGTRASPTTGSRPAASCCSTPGTACRRARFARRGAGIRTARPPSGCARSPRAPQRLMRRPPGCAIGSTTSFAKTRAPRQALDRLFATPTPTGCGALSADSQTGRGDPAVQSGAGNARSWRRGAEAWGVRRLQLRRGFRRRRVGPRPGCEAEAFAKRWHARRVRDDARGAGDRPVRSITQQFPVACV